MSVIGGRQVTGGTAYSGQGLRIIAKGSLPPDGRKKGHVELILPNLAILSMEINHYNKQQPANYT